MAIRLEFLDSKQHVQRAHHIVYLGKDCMLPIDHGIRSGALLGKVDHSLRLKLLENRTQEFVVGDIANEGSDVLS